MIKQQNKAPADQSAGALHCVLVVYLHTYRLCIFHKKAKSAGQTFQRFGVACLLLYGSTHRAGLGAGAAIDALIGVDHELAIAFGNRLHGAIGRASATADAIVGDFVCQGHSPPLRFGGIPNGTALGHMIPCERAFGKPFAAGIRHRIKGCDAPGTPPRHDGNGKGRKVFSAEGYFASLRSFCRIGSSFSRKTD